MPVRDSWFEVFEVTPAVFARYEPHQAEETIGYLIVGHKQAVLFDTGMGISDIRHGEMHDLRHTRPADLARLGEFLVGVYCAFSD